MPDAPEVAVTAAPVEESLSDDEKNEHMSVLMLACTMGELKTVDMIIKLGGNVNAISSIQATPLIYATSTQNHEVMKLLLKHGADKNMKSITGKTAFDVAKEKGDKIAMKILQ